MFAVCLRKIYQSTFTFQSNFRNVFSAAIIIIISWCENYFAAEAYSALLVIKLFNNLPFAPTKYLTSAFNYSINVHWNFTVSSFWFTLSLYLPRIWKMNIRDLHNAQVILLCVLIFQLFIWLATAIYLY